MKRLPTFIAICVILFFGFIVYVNLKVIDNENNLSMNYYLADFVPLIILIIILFLPRRKVKPIEKSDVSLLKVFYISSFLDFIIVGFLSYLLILQLEDYFLLFYELHEKDLLKGTVIYALIYCYYFLHIKYDRQTIGQYLSGFKVIKNTDKWTHKMMLLHIWGMPSKFFKRLIYTPNQLKDDEFDFWNDEMAGTCYRLVHYDHNE